METLTTTIEWNLEENGLPETSGRYLIVHPNGIIMTVDFSKKYNKFNANDFVDEEQAEEYSLQCVYWAEYPDYFSWANLEKYREE